jgi:hypothetical protein
MNEKYTLSFLISEFRNTHPLKGDYKIRNYIEYINKIQIHLDDERKEYEFIFDEGSSIFRFLNDNKDCLNFDKCQSEKLKEEFDEIRKISYSHIKIHTLIKLSNAYKIEDIKNNIIKIETLKKDFKNKLHYKAEVLSNCEDYNEFIVYYIRACDQTTKVLEANLIIAEHNDKIDTIVKIQEPKFKKLYNMYSSVISDSDEEALNLSSGEISLQYINNNGEEVDKYLLLQLYLYNDFLSTNFSYLLNNDNFDIEFEGSGIFGTIEYDIDFNRIVKDKIINIEKKLDKLINDCSTINYNYIIGDNPKQYDDGYIQQFVSLQQFEDTLNVQFKRLHRNIDNIANCILYLYTTMFNEITNINDYHKLIRNIDEN